MRDRGIAAALIASVVFIAGVVIWFAATIMPREVQVIGLLAILVGIMAFLLDSWQNMPKEK